jgi:hypothetical protein
MAKKGDDDEKQWGLYILLAVLGLIVMALGRLFGTHGTIDSYVAGFIFGVGCILLVSGFVGLLMQ